jgi:hypothetical protein
MNGNENIVIEISEYDNRWNKMAVEISKRYLNPNLPEIKDRVTVENPKIENELVPKRSS